MAILLAVKVSTFTFFFLVAKGFPDLHRKCTQWGTLPKRPGYSVFSRQELKETEGKVHVWEAGGITVGKVNVTFSFLMFGGSKCL